MKKSSVVNLLNYLDGRINVVQDLIEIGKEHGHLSILDNIGDEIELAQEIIGIYRKQYDLTREKVDDFDEKKELAVI